MLVRLYVWGTPRGGGGGGGAAAGLLPLQLWMGDRCYIRLTIC